MMIPAWLLPLIFTIVAFGMAYLARSRDFGAVIWFIVAWVLSCAAWLSYILISLMY